MCVVDGKHNIWFYILKIRKLNSCLILDVNPNSTLQRTTARYFLRFQLLLRYLSTIALLQELSTLVELLSVLLLQVLWSIFFVGFILLSIYLSSSKDKSSRFRLVSKNKQACSPKDLALVSIQLVVVNHDTSFQTSQRTTKTYQ